MPLYPGGAAYRDGLITVADALADPTRITDQIAALTEDSVLVDLNRPGFDAAAV